MKTTKKQSLELRWQKTDRHRSWQTRQWFVCKVSRAKGTKSRHAK